MKHISIFFLFVLCLVGAVAPANSQTFGIQYGPRAFWPAPIGTNAINVKYEHLNASQSINGIFLKNFDITTDSAMVSYTRYFDFFGQTASVLAALPYVWMQGDLVTTRGSFPVFSEAGVPDPYFQFYSTIIGGEALELREYVSMEPGFIMGAFAAARPPLGEYDQLIIANTGANRWEWRLGMPIQYISGLPTQQTSIEFVPTVLFFGENDEMFGGGTLTQKPFFQLEAHLTHDFSQMFWGSLNILHGFGGETSVNGVGQTDAISYLSGGITIGARLSRSLGVSASYGRRLWSQQSGNDGNWLSLSLTTTF